MLHDRCKRVLLRTRSTEHFQIVPQNAAECKKSRPPHREAALSPGLTPSALLSFSRLPCGWRARAALLRIDLERCVAHDIARALVFRERDDVADGAALRHEHHEAVETEREAAMGRRAVLERVHHEAELRVCLLRREAERPRRPAPAAPRCRYAGSATADLDAVEYHVVGVRLHGGSLLRYWISSSRGAVNG